MSPEAIAEELALAWEEGRRSDARIVAAWLAEQGIHPDLLAAQARDWSDFDWRVIEDETGIPCPVSVRNHAIAMLRGAA